MNGKSMDHNVAERVPMIITTAVVAKRHDFMSSCDWSIRLYIGLRTLWRLPVSQKCQECGRTPVSEAINHTCSITR